MLVAVENLRLSVRNILMSVINLHIDILVLDSTVSKLIDEVRDINADLLEVDRLDRIIAVLKDYNCTPTIYHEWPYPPLSEVENVKVERADVAETTLHKASKILSLSPSTSTTGLKEKQCDEFTASTRTATAGPASYHHRRRRKVQ
ncbi:hypothetical protein ACFFRR_010996 [Megaselia abdita]